eukprot:311434_1
MFLILFCTFCLTLIKANIPWEYDGFKRFPSVFFGASPHNLESQETMQLISNHSVGGWGWQQNNTYIFGSEEKNLYSQAKAFFDYVDNSSSNAYHSTKSTFVYRDAMSASAWWNTTLAIINDTSYSDFWIKNNQGKVCWTLPGMTTGGQPLWDFRNETACNYYIDNIINEVLSNKQYINSVFFDEFNWITCSFNFSTNTNCSQFSFSDQDKKDIGMSSIKLFQKASKILNVNGIVPILSVSGVVEKYLNRTKCVIAEEKLIDELSDVDWIRYYESFPDFWPGQTGSYFFLNRIEEMKYNIPVQIHSYGVNPNTTIDPYYIATFLMTQQEYSYFGGSNGWYDDNWSWHDAYNVYYGKPLMEPKQINDTAWFRSFENCNVTLDIQSRQTNIDMF